MVDLLRARWTDGVPKCPTCAEPCVERAVDGKRSRHGKTVAYRWEGWRCDECGVDFTITSGTWLHGTRLPLEVWVDFASLVAFGAFRASQFKELGLARMTVKRMRKLASRAGVTGAGSVDAIMRGLLTPVGKQHRLRR